MANKQGLLGLSALAMGLLASPAALGAGEPGWYVGGSGAFSKLEDADNRSRTEGSVSPGTPGSCTIEIPGVLCVLPQPGDPPVVTPPGPQNSRFTFDDGFAVGLTFGYVFEGGLRPELSLGYAENDIETVELREGFPEQGTFAVDDARYQAIRLLGNLWYDIDLTDFYPYFGGGLGLQQTKLDGAGSADDTTVSYQLGAGVGIPLSDLWTLSVDYRYLVADNPEFQNDQNQPLESEYNNQTLGVGLRYALGTGFGGVDSDGDGVPDRKDRCPNTPKGVTVYADGCPTDQDQDGVPDYQDKCPNTPPGTVVNEVGCPVDSDGDGVPDFKDECPGTPAGVQVSANGCPLDADGDGVPDYLDQCPDSPAGQAVNAQGCPLTDSDGDGVPDNVDKCPDSPKGQPVGPDGCPLDSDGDGIPDYLDECPNTPPGLKVLPDGCAPVGDCRKPRGNEPVDARGCALDKRFILRGVKFELDSDRLTPQAQLILNDVADTLAAYPELKVDVEGHTDSSGTDAYNLGLSERRSISVKTYLTSRGVKDEALRPVGYGEANPIDSNDTEDGRENNRRVEFKVTAG
ncbi:MAG TPA: thrombospondin type 3 repeat-containing protein [Nevskiaceae bacterium]|nr:thrombospondin type 3 repeat-containing protein [Nevskiaceae bacterium]